MIIRPKALINPILYLYTFGVYIGAEMLSINIGFMHLTIDRFLQPVLLLMCLYKIAPYVQSHGTKIPLKKNTYSVVFFIFWFAYSLLTGIWAPDHYAWLRGCYFIFSGVLVILTFSLYVHDLKTVERILIISMCMSVIHLCIGIYEIITGDYLFLIATRIAKYSYLLLPVSCMGNVNDYAMLLMIGVFSSIAVFCVSRRKTVKFISLLAATLMTMICVFFTRSRGIVYGLIFSLVVTCLYFRRVRKKIFLLAGAGIVIFIILATVHPAIKGSTLDMVEKLRSGIFNFLPFKQSVSDSIRLNLIRNGLIFLKENLLMGVGTGCIEHYMSLCSIYDTDYIINMHNWWFEILVSNGIFIFVAYCVFYQRLMKHLFLNSRCKTDTSPNDLDYIAWCLGAFTVAYTIASVSSSSNLGANIIWHYFALAIAVEGMVNLKRSTSKNSSRKA